MRDVLNEMIEIYQPNGIDWMGYEVSKNNPYTFHHIVEKRYGGREEIKNGAILTKRAHEYLNWLDQYCPMAYLEYQDIFRYINGFNGPIPKHLYDIIYDEIHSLAYEIEFGNRFSFYKDARDFKEEKKEMRKSKSNSLRKKSCR